MALTKIVASRSGHRTTLIPFSGIVDDGSTLSLDFTTGVLDPRLTFTRLSNATFINSSGLVQWADSNLAVNSAFGGTSPGTGWTTNGSGSMSSNAGTFTAQVTSAATAFLSRIIAVSSGLRYSASVNVTTIIGTINYNEVITIGGTLSSAKFYRNGVEVGTNGNGVAQAQTGLITVIWTCGGTNTIRFGIGASGTNHTNVTVALDSPRVVPGEVTQATYFASTTTAEYHAPRFDYDPTSIGTPRGLLIEAAANNLARYSDTLETTGGFWSGNIANRTPETSDVNPTGSTGSMSFAPASTGGSRYWGLFLTGQTTTVAYTYSVWVKAKGTSSLVVSIQNSAGAVNSNARIISQPSGANASFTGSGGGFPQINNLSATGWTRIELTTTATLGGTGALNVFMYPSNTTTQTTADSVFAWGAQLEAGSGASSYIPTGSSTGNRQADNCVTAIGNLTGFNANQGTIYESWRDNTASDAISVPIPVQEWAFAFGTSGANGCGVFVSNAASGTFGLSGGISNTGDAGPAGTYVIQGVNKAAIAINVATTSLRLSANGSAVSAGTNIAGYNGAQTFALGQRNNNTRYLNGWISQFKYWPYVLPDAQLTTLTTL